MKNKPVILITNGWSGRHSDCMFCQCSVILTLFIKWSIRSQTNILHDYYIIQYMWFFWTGIQYMCSQESLGSREKRGKWGTTKFKRILKKAKLPSRLTTYDLICFLYMIKKELYHLIRVYDNWKTALSL